MTLAIVLLFVGISLLFADVFVPTMGVLSFLGAAALLWSIGAAFGESTATGYTFLVLVALLVPTAIVVGLKLFPRSPLGKHVVVGGLSFEAAAATDERDLSLVGAEGVALSDLRPAGHARIQERRVDVVSRGEPIESGSPVRVIEVSGNRVVVVPIAPVRPSDSQSSSPPTP